MIAVIILQKKRILSKVKEIHYKRAFMSELVQMRQRIKAIETIKKITHAMRLISMSAHSRLKHKQEPLITYVQEFNTLFAKLQLLAPDWKNPILSSATEQHFRPLVILIGSQKGLCGSFNTALFHVCTQHIEKLQTPPHLIAIGKKAVDHIHDFPGTVLATFDQFSVRNLFIIARDVANLIAQTQPPFTHVDVLSNKMQNFFIQRPQVHKLVPFEHEKQTTSLDDEYLWEQKPHLILDNLVQQYLETQLQSLLFQSLLAEHAARFISMDSSTRNAENLLESSKLQYNKLRQAKITKELTELVGSF